jgi:predicted metalloprotease with PDZ domain
VFVHADRPLVASDLTSPVLHEIIHATLGIRSGPGGDWVVEGLAELYSLELLVRSKTLSKARHRKALALHAEYGAGVTALDVDAAVGPIAARAATALHELDLELRRGSEGRLSLDDVVRRLAAARGAITTESFRRTVDEVAGRSLGAFFRSRIPLAKQPALP